MQHHDAIRDLTTIGNLWPRLDWEPGTRPVRGNNTSTPNPGVLAARAAAWAAERVDVAKGIHGRGASPAPLDIDALSAHLEIQTAILALADEIAARTQTYVPLPKRKTIERVSLSKTKPSVRISRQTVEPDPTRWRYADSWIHGVPWACTWLCGALDRGLPPNDVARLAGVAAKFARRLTMLVEGGGQAVRDAGVCPCGTPLTVAPGDPVITCTGCREARGRTDWLGIAAAMAVPPAPRVDTRPPLIDEHEQQLRDRWSAA